MLTKNDFAPVTASLVNCENRVEWQESGCMLSWFLPSLPAQLDLWHFWLTCKPFRLSLVSLRKLETWRQPFLPKQQLECKPLGLKNRNLIVLIPLGTNIGLSYKRPTASLQWFIAEFQSFSIHYSFQIVFKLSVEEKRPLGDAEKKIIFKYSCSQYLIIESVH